VDGICFIRSEIGWHAITLGSDVKHYQSTDHINNSSGHKKRVDDQKYCVYERNSSVGGLWKQEIEYGFAIEDDHQADSDGRSVEILLCVDHAYRIQGDQWIEQPQNTDPNEHSERNPRDFFRIHFFYLTRISWRILVLKLERLLKEALRKGDCPIFYIESLSF
jgi:hypothetical protein